MDTNRNISREILLSVKSIKKGRKKYIFKIPDDVVEIKLAFHSSTIKKRRFGVLKGKIKIADDFDAPLS